MILNGNQDNFFCFVLFVSPDINCNKISLFKHDINYDDSVHHNDKQVDKKMHHHIHDLFD
jgi:hypothetical protein